MFHHLLAILVLSTLWLPHSSDAGPWLREKGSTFSAVSFASTYYLETASQTYLEYGLSESTTLIADLGMVRLHNAANGGYITLSLKRAIGASDSPSKWAYEMGVGVGWVGEETLPHLRTGLSWGRGTNWANKSGWINVEGAVIWDLTHQIHVAKLDTTIGHNFTDVTSGMLQFYSAHVAGRTIVTLAPSILVEPRNRKYKIQLGSESEIGNWGNTALKIGIWREF